MKIKDGKITKEPIEPNEKLNLPNTLTVKEIKKIMERLPDESIVVIYYKNKSNCEYPDLIVFEAFADYVEDVLVLEAKDFNN